MQVAARAMANTRTKSLVCIALKASEEPRGRKAQKAADYAKFLSR
jgi:hypothetical protein